MKADDVVDTVQHSFATNLCEVFMQVLAAASGSVWRSAVMDVAPDQEKADDVRLNLEFKGSISGEVQIDFQHNGAIIAAAILLGHSIEEIGEAETRAILDLANKALSEFNKLLSPSYGSFETDCSLAAEDPQERKLELVPYIAVSISDDASHQLSLRIAMSDAVVRALEVLPLQDSDRTKTDHDNAGGTVGSTNLDLVLDVELNVTLRFGRRQLTLREVLELTSGSVIELDRQVDEPVELILDGKVIARGEAVVIDGNYGLRVTEVPHAISTTLL